MVRNIQTELTNWAKILESEKLCSNTTPITNEIGKIRTNKLYHIQKLKLGPFNPPRNTIPSNICDLYTVLDVKFKLSETNETDINNNIIEYSFNITFIGEGYDDKNYYSSFHLDYDTSDNADVVHPWFHFTYGGHGLKEEETGNVLLLTSPRLPYMPMDFFLGIDFILSNFLRKTVYDKIKSNSMYKKALEHSQCAIWKPYVLSIAHHWCKFSNCQYNLIDKDLSRHFVPTLI
ncbi:hypothetical protein [Bacteroides caecimuris]|jgi:hypothetical protein|uniref:hypothetical protein n=2 Tax=Bacteroides TaxID=816 RepID=UPI002647B5BC|nr:MULTISPECIES: hypothetical protein [Bacteroides]